MNRRILGIVAAVLLAGVGTFVLVRYVQSADERALEGQETVEVLVVEQRVPQGAPAEEITDQVRTELVPRSVLAEGSIATLDDVSGRVAGVDLVPGEQLVAARFVTAEALQETEAFVVPDGLLEVTIALSPERAVGGELVPGDLVGLIASFNPFTLDAVEPESAADLQEFLGEGETGGGEPTALRTPHTSHLTVHQALVSNVQAASLPADEAPRNESGQSVTPSGSLLVTLAVPAPDVEKVVFASEFGSIWLAKEQETSSDEGTRVVTRANVYL